MEDLYSILDVLEQPGKKVLATIIHVSGSAYKKQGSTMLFFENGRQIGMISAGCLETDLAIHAEIVMKRDQSLMLQYDMSDQSDLSWGQGAGCNGTIDILLEPVKEELKADLLKLKDYLANQLPVLSLKKIGDEGEYLFIPSEGEPFGKWKGEIPLEYSEAKSGLAQNKTIFQHVIQPKPRLIVFGAGPDAKPLVSLAAKTGFSVHVCDWREELCQKMNFPDADQVIVGFPKEIFKRIRFTAKDFVVIMSHHFQKDQEILLSLTHENVKYIGVLGPRERTKRLLNGEEASERISTPIGVAIGAQGPEEIAVSVMAELIKKLRNPVR